ncbi:MAG: hypothetical protein K0R15_1639 [Clostridiales bacterium]|jgi:hypothetical protein|nr:hypothetical protein [Clostridiales bacterium]
MKHKLVMLVCTVALVIGMTGCKGKPEIIDKEPQNTVTTTIEKEPEETITKTPDEVDYKIENKTYSKDQIRVVYPRISGLENVELEEQVNRVLEEFATKNIENYSEDDTYEMDFEVVTQTNEMISIIMRGYQNVVGAAHPSAFVGSLNVDLVNGKIVRLADIENVDEIAQKIIDNTGLVIRDIDGNVIEGIFKDAVDDYLSMYTKERLVEELSGFDIDIETNSWAEGYSYYKDGKLHIYLGVPHAIGDFVDIEVE